MRHPIGASDQMTQRHVRILHTKSWLDETASVFVERDHHFIRVNHVHILAQKFSDKVRISSIRVQPVDLVFEHITLFLEICDLRVALLKQVFAFIPRKQASGAGNRETCYEQQRGKRESLPNLLFWNAPF